jgi:hypothetical protein
LADDFPQAEIIFAIAGTDVLEQTSGAARDVDRLELPPNHQLNGGVAGSRAAADTSLRPHSPLRGSASASPIKFDPKVNNANLQIVAAKAGLARATRSYALRVRSDFLFLDRSLLSFYARNASLPRGLDAVFRQRIMISPYFTLNPFTMERLPFHFSDWFHFGLRDDVQKVLDR